LNFEIYEVVFPVNLEIESKEWNEGDREKEI